jgi:histidyl-tRNA synthetase
VRGTLLCPRRAAGLCELQSRHNPGRYERPQKGRYRQFEQFGVERFDRASGSTDDDSSVARDADIVGLAAHYLAAVGVLGSVELQVNFLGDTDARRVRRTAQYLLPDGASYGDA